MSFKLEESFYTNNAELRHYLIEMFGSLPGRGCGVISWASDIENDCKILRLSGEDVEGDYCFVLDKKPYRIATVPQPSLSFFQEIRRYRVSSRSVFVRILSGQGRDCCNDERVNSLAREGVATLLRDVEIVIDDGKRFCISNPLEWIRAVMAAAMLFVAALFVLFIAVIGKLPSWPKKSD